MKELERKSKDAFEACHANDTTPFADVQNRIVSQEDERFGKIAKRHMYAFVVAVSLSYRWYPPILYLYYLLKCHVRLPSKPSSKGFPEHIVRRLHKSFIRKANENTQR